MHEEFIRPGIEHSLGRLVEECGEVSQACGKSIRFGLFSYNPHDETMESNIDWILRELDDLEDSIRRFRKEAENLKTNRRNEDTNEL